MFHRCDLSDGYSGPCDACGRCDTHPLAREIPHADDRVPTPCRLDDGWMDDAYTLLCPACYGRLRDDEA